MMKKLNIKKIIINKRDIASEDKIWQTLFFLKKSFLLLFLILEKIVVEEIEDAYL